MLMNDLMVVYAQCALHIIWKYYDGITMLLWWYHDDTMMRLTMLMMLLMVYECKYYTKRKSMLSPLWRMIMWSFNMMSTVVISIWQLIIQWWCSWLARKLSWARESCMKATVFLLKLVDVNNKTAGAHFWKIYIWCTFKVTVTMIANQNGLCM